MTLDVYDGLNLVLLTAGYWLIDLAIRRDGLLKLGQRIGLKQERLVIGLCALLSLGLASVWRWDHIAQGDTLRILATTLTLFLTWKATTKDIDPVSGESHMGLRGLLLVASAGVYVSPGILLLTSFLLTTPFSLWQHHATMPMRVVQALLAHVCLATALSTTPLFADVSVLVFFIVTIQISHYLITALAKALLGPKWYSWVLDNHLHHIAASAYSWGWARFVPWPTWRKVIGALKVFERPMQFFAFTIELLAPLALLHPDVAIMFCVGWTCFHVGVFAFSGLLFWDWMLTNLSVALMLAMLPASVTAHIFGPWAVLVSVVFMLMFPLRHKLWAPMPLGWWDTPFTQRIHWRVKGASGKIYGLYNNFMCPHERLYGKVHACFLAPKQVFSYHLGEVWKHELRDAIRNAGPHPERLDEVRERFGIDPCDAQMAENHIAYIKSFFGQLNRGARKHVLPKPLRWLKAPGGQCFYWGELPAYRAQEPAVQVSLHYREEYFDGEVLQRLCERHVLDIDIDDDEACAAVRELTPKEIDNHLLSRAQGRLIDLPGFGDGYVNTDDGKVRKSASSA